MKNKGKPVLLYHDNEGIVDIEIPGKGCYKYRIDAARIPSIVSQFRFAPWAALGVLKYSCEWWVDTKGVLHESGAKTTPA